MSEDINKRSEEVQDIVDRMPTDWTTWVTVIMTVIVAVMTFLSIVIKYPDTVSGQVTLTAVQAPIRLVSGAAGRLHLLKQDKDIVGKGEIIAYIESGAQLKDVLTVEKISGLHAELDICVQLPRHLILGDLSASYNNFVLAYEQLDQLRHTGLYRNMRKSLAEQIRVDKGLVTNLNAELLIKDDILRNVRTRLGKDSLLQRNGALSEEDLTSQRNSYLSQKEANVNLCSSKISKQSEIRQNRVEMAKTDMEEAEKIRDAYFSMTTSLNKLASDIKQWKEKYLFVSTISGRLEYLGFWRENSFVQSTQEVFSVLPVHNRICGEAYVPINGAGKIRPGQEVNIKLNDYPYNEYGLIKGRVKDISEISNHITTTNGDVETYRVRISLPYGAVTNFGRRLKLKFEAKGTADVITKKKRLIQRLFDNLKAHEGK
jgi:multidrug efflux pump subunit AcrA (membrane-fusion protein)